MPNFNLYATLSDYKKYAIARGGTSVPDANDDGVIVDLLERASRYMDTKTRRQFYPSVETRLYDIPGDSELMLDADLLSLTTLTNGDATVISSSDYVLQPANATPKYNIVLKGDSSVGWEADSDNDSEQVISVLGWWGYREKYSQRGWSSVGTLGANITDTTTLAFTMTAGHSVSAGHILKVDSEIYNANTVAGDTVTPFSRGDNGSTAATHTSGATVYKWNPQEEIVGAVLEIANSAYQRRFGKATGESAQVTAAGVVLTPRDIPAMAEEVAKSLMRLV